MRGLRDYLSANREALTEAQRGSAEALYQGMRSSADALRATATREEVEAADTRSPAEKAQDEARAALEQAKAWEEQQSRAREAAAAAQAQGPGGSRDVPGRARTSVPAGDLGEAGFTPAEQKSNQGGPPPAPAKRAGRGQAETQGPAPVERDRRQADLQERYQAIRTAMEQAQTPAEAAALMEDYQQWQEDWKAAQEQKQTGFGSNEQKTGANEQKTGANLQKTGANEQITRMSDKNMHVRAHPEAGLQADGYARATLDREGMDLLDGYGKITGTRIRFAEPGELKHRNANGQISGNEILLNREKIRNSQEAAQFVAGHEITHRLQRTAGKEYRALREYVMSLETYAGLVERRIEEYAGEGVALTREEAMDEITADFAGALLTDSKALQDFILRNTRNRSLLQRVLDAIRDFAAKVTGRTREQADEAVRLLEEALGASKETVAELEKSGNEKTAREGGEVSITRFCLKDPRTLTEQDVEELLYRCVGGELEKGTYFPVRINTPAVMIWALKEKLKISIPDLPLIMDANKGQQALLDPGIDDGGSQEHGIPVPKMIDILKRMSRPNYIIYQANGRVSIVVSANVGETKRGFAVIDFEDPRDPASINEHNKNPDVMNGYAGGVYHILVTVFPPRDTAYIKGQLSNPNNTVIYNKEEEDITKKQPAALVPSLSNDIPFYKESISQEDGEVKRFSFGSGLEAARLARENEVLREKVNYWRSRVKGQDRKLVEPREVRKLAEEIAKDMSATMKQDEIANRLEELYNGLRNDWSFDRTFGAAMALAREIVEGSEEIDDTAYREYEAMRKYFRETPLVLSPSDREQITDYNDWRKRQMGRMRGVGRPTLKGRLRAKT